MAEMNIAFRTLETNLGIPIEIQILLVIIIGCIIFYAKSFQFGVLMTFIMSGASFMLFYGLNLAFGYGLNYTYSLVLFFISLVLMALILSANFGTKQHGGLV